MTLEEVYRHDHFKAFMRTRINKIISDKLVFCFPSELDDWYRRLFYQDQYYEFLFQLQEFWWRFTNTIPLGADPTADQISARPNQFKVWTLFLLSDFKFEYLEKVVNKVVDDELFDTIFV